MEEAEYFIKENKKEIHQLKKQNLYCLKKIKESKEQWEKKEYRQVIKDNLNRIGELAHHNKKLGGFN